VHFRDEASGVGVELAIANHVRGEAGAIDAAHRRVETIGGLRMARTGVVAMKDAVRVDPDHVR